MKKSKSFGDVAKPKVGPHYNDRVKFSYPDNKPNFGLMEDSNKELLSSGFGKRIANKTITPKYDNYPGSPTKIKPHIIPQKIKIKPYG